MFLGCPFFKVSERYCRYFVCLDEHLKKIRVMESDALGAVEDAGGVDVEDQVVRSEELEKKLTGAKSGTGEKNGRVGEETVMYGEGKK
ncbi:hypothetical protein Ahy_A05g024047 [Arachis hypogaea]|uniref:Uncharacterized protein n=1 Tax=Arachis hypogaea TaxID=3818 RepID=A0A445D553_ARAHY|nr:hypothetical protein Ahy_A05g024047 [Arachis hypogaea]